LLGSKIFSRPLLLPRKLSTITMPIPTELPPEKCNRTHSTKWTDGYSGAGASNFVLVDSVADENVQDFWLEE
jgi:hypothetical protein